MQAAARGAPGVYRPAQHSEHERGLAFDLSASPPTLASLHALWLSWGGAAAASGDAVHFQPRIEAGGLNPEQAG